MKDNLFELLLTLFEQSLNQLHEVHQSDEQLQILDDDTLSNNDRVNLHLKSPNLTATRVLTYDEQMKLTKISYQFLMRMKLWGLIDSDQFELIMNQLQFSDSRIVTLQETKWTIRSVLESYLSEEQLAFLDLVLYKTEDKFEIH